MQLDDDIIRTFGIGRVYKVIPHAEIATLGLMLHMQPWCIRISQCQDRFRWHVDCRKMQAESIPWTFTELRNYL